MEEWTDRLSDVFRRFKAWLLPITRRDVVLMVTVVVLVGLLSRCA